MAKDTYMCPKCYAEFDDYAEYKRHLDTHKNGG